VVRWNATRHGIRSPAPVIPGVEKVEDWEEHRVGILESLSPEGHLEEVLAERVALLSWRLNRVTRYETETIALSQEKMEDDLADKRRFDSYLLGATHPEDVRGAVHDARRVQRLIKQFPKLPGDKRLSALMHPASSTSFGGRWMKRWKPKRCSCPKRFPSGQVLRGT
jgi:hypothetical protein